MKSKLFTLFTLCSAISMNVQAETAASAIANKKDTLFLSDSHPDQTYRIPAIVTLKNGTVFAFTDHRPCGNDIGHGDVDIYVKTSTDNGQNWSPASNDPCSLDEHPGRIADGPEDNSSGYGDAAVVADSETNEVLAICVSGAVVYGEGTSSSHNKMARIYYNGESWSEPEDVTDAFFANLLPDACTMFMASGRMLQSTKVKGESGYHRIYGALLVREVDKSYGSFYTTYKEVNYVVYSDDFGKSWKLLGGACITGNPNEAKLAWLPNGNLLISSRATGGRIFNIFTFTDEESATGSWGTQQTATLASGAEECNGELLKYENVINKETGKEATILLQSMPTASSRGNVSVFYKDITNSTDYDEVSDFTAESIWKKGIEVDEGTSGYSAMTIMDNREIGFLYEADLADKFANIVFVPLTVSEITGGAYTKTVHDPIISVASGEVEANTTVEISCLTEGATIYYTIDGTEPTSASAAYTGAITITEDVTIKAIAVKSDCNDSEVATATYTVKTTTEEGGGETEGGEGEEGGEEEGGDTGSEDTTIPAVGSTVPWSMSTVTGCTASCGTSTYATLYLPHAVKVPYGVTAFYGKLSDDRTKLVIYKISSGIVPANRAVILEDVKARTSITLTVVETATDITGNALQGTLTDLNLEEVSDKDNYYVFGHAGSHLGFYHSASTTIPAGKAYLYLTAAEARSLIITRGDAEGTTAIAPLPAVDDDASAPEYYTLQGVKVDVPTRGIYIMKHHGQTRKVVVK